MSNSKKTKNIIIIGGIIIFTCVCLYAASKIKVNGNTEIVVSREREYIVERGNIISAIDSSGKIILDKIDLNFKNPSTIKDIFVRVGQRISEGEEVAISSRGEKIYASVSGIVSKIGYSPKEETTSDIAVITIADSCDILGEIMISQDNIFDIEVGQKVYLWISAHQGIQFEGVVDFINLTPESSNGQPQYAVSIRVNTSDYELLDEMAFTAQFILKESKDVLTLSNKAITNNNGKQIVFVRDDEGNIIEREIETGFSDGKKSEILGGLLEGDVVIVGGQ